MSNSLSQIIREELKRLVEPSKIGNLDGMVHYFRQRTANELIKKGYAEQHGSRRRIRYQLTYPEEARFMIDERIIQHYYRPRPESITNLILEVLAEDYKLKGHKAKNKARSLRKKVLKDKYLLECLTPDGKGKRVRYKVNNYQSAKEILRQLFNEYETQTS